MTLAKIASIFLLLLTIMTTSIIINNNMPNKISLITPFWTITLFIIYLAFTLDTLKKQ